MLFVSVFLFFFKPNPPFFCFYFYFIFLPLRKTDFYIFFPSVNRPNSHVAPPRKNASTLHGILRRLHADRFRTFDLVRPPLQQHGRTLLRSRLPTRRTLGKLVALGGHLWSDFGVGKRRSGDVVAGGLVSICEEWESDSDDCADYCLSVDDLCGLYVELDPPPFFSCAFFKGERCVVFGWSWGSWYTDADADGEI